MVLGHDTNTSERTQDIKIPEDVSFDSMLLSPNTLKGLKASGFHVPSPIQLHGIPLGKCGFDLLLEAKSGTGKTAVFSVIALEKLNLDKGIQTLVLAPTREIASQICDVIKTIGVHFMGLSVEVVMGGLPVAEDVEKFKKKVHIVVGSPGRLHHLITDKLIDISAVRLMVLDEADKLMEKSFLSDINYIFSLLPNQKQIIMSSATYPANVKTIMSNYVQNAHHICPDSNSVLLGIEQNIILVPNHINILKQIQNRYVELVRILSRKEFKQCLVFCNYQARVREVHRLLCRNKWPADKLYGQQEQSDRLQALQILQNYQCRILVTTDLAARGIDASNVDLVINFEIPYGWETYLHRIGRAGRYGSYGTAVSIICEGDEEQEFRKLIESINIPFDLIDFWSKEPFLKCCKSVKLCHEDGTELNVKNTQNKLGIKETYEELWKTLSLDTTALKVDNIDIPTFQSLCDSYEQVKAKSKTENNQMCSELMHSLENHQNMGNEQPSFIYKHVEVNKLIIPSTIFNPNVVLQSFKQEREVEVVGQEDETNAEENDYQCEINSIDLYSGQSSKSKPEKKNEISSINNNANINTGNRSCGSNYNGYFNGVIENENVNNDFHLNLPSTSGISKYKCITASTQDNNSSNNYKSPIVHVPYNFAFSKIKGNRDEQSESDETDNDSVNKNNYGQSYECNKDEEKTLPAANLPVAFGKCNQWKSGKNNSFNNNNTDNEQNLKQKKYLENESSDDEINTELSFSHSVVRGKTSIENHYHSKTRKNHTGLGNHNNEIQARQNEFNQWYQQLQAHMEMIERSVYIDVMSSLFV